MCPGFSANISALFASILLTRVYADVRKVAYVRPLHKRGPRNMISNYRPISFYEGIAIFERIIPFFLYQISLHTDFHPQQLGFRQKSSVLQLIEYIENIHRHNASCTFTIYLDYERAFDKVSRSILLSKLSSLDLDCNLGDLLRNYISDCIQHIKNETFVSDTIYVVSGVPHGSVLGP